MPQPRDILARCFRMLPNHCYRMRSVACAHSGAPFVGADVAAYLHVSERVERADTVFLGAEATTVDSPGQTALV